MLSDRKRGFLEPSALNDVLDDELLRGGTGYVLQELAEELVVGVGIYPRGATRLADGRCSDPQLKSARSGETG
jgi:hypothetical protein